MDKKNDFHFLDIKKHQEDRSEEIVDKNESAK